MRNISIDLAKGNITMPIFCGYDGEHKVSVLTIALPSDMVAPNYVYKVLYRTSVGSQIEDNDFHDLIDENKLTCTLYSHVMKPGILRLQVIAYKQDENDSSTLEIIAKTQMIPLLVKESITGEADEVIIKVDNNDTYWTESMAQMRAVSEQVTEANNTLDGLNSSNAMASSNISILQTKNEQAISTIDALHNILNEADADRRMNLIKKYLDARANAESDFIYEINNDTVSIINYTGSHTDVKIPHIINNRIVTEIKDHAFERSEINSITIPNTIIEIGSHAFILCESLYTVIFEDNSVLQTIGESAFAMCTQLHSIELPESLVNIGRQAFGGCSNLEIVVAKNTLNITSWGDNIFISCSDNLTLYEGKGHCLKDEARLKGYNIKRYIYNQPFTDLFYALEACTTVEQIVSQISGYLDMTD